MRAILQVADTEYRLIPGLPTYRVGTDGSIWSSSRFGPKRGRKRDGNWFQLNPTEDQDGYLRVTLCINGKVLFPEGVHRYVLLAFVGECPEGMQACHNDGNPGNNRLDNLRWGTPSNNNRDKWLHGTEQTGERNPNAVLTEEQVRDIREMSKVYGGQAAAARKYGVHQDTVGLIHQRVTWGWLV